MFCRSYELLIANNNLFALMFFNTIPELKQFANTRPQLKSGEGENMQKNREKKKYTAWYESKKRITRKSASGTQA